MEHGHTSQPAPTMLDLERMRRDIADCLSEPASAINDDDDLLRLGLDSMSVMLLASQWRHAGAEVTFAELIENRTLGEWWALVEPRRRPPETGQTPPVADPDPGAPFALAEMQHAYWVGRRDGQPLGGVGAHFYAELDGAGVDPDRLERAVDALVLRHGMLRSVFLPDGRQQIEPRGRQAPLQVRDLRNNTADGVDRELATARDEMSHRRLAVETGEVLAVALSLLPDGRTRLHLQIEMLVADADSFRHLLAELAGLYTDPEVELHPLSLTYPAYRSLVDRSRSDLRDRAAAFWRNRLADLPGAPELPLVADPATVHRHRMSRRHLWLSGAEATTLTDRAAHHGLTLPMVLLTGLVDVLRDYSATEDFVVNLPFYNRQPLHPDVDHLVGDFTELILFQVGAERADSFADRCRGLQADVHRDMQHTSYSGMEVLRDLARLRGPSPVVAPVVFTSAVSLGELFSPQVRETFGDPVWTMSQTPQVCLDFQVTEREGGLYLNWDVVEELFPAGVIDAMWHSMTDRIEGLLADPATWTQDDLDTLPAATRQIRQAANNSSRTAPPRTLHGAVFEQARRDPDRVALIGGDGSAVSFGELARRSLILAGQLAAHQVRAAEPVLVTVPRGTDQVVAVLGVLAAGGSYVPVGVDQPSVRRNRIAETAGARLAVAMDDEPASPTGIASIPVDADDHPALTAPVEVDPTAVAYTLFTSGSTGLPKGVLVTHSAATNTIDGINGLFGVGAADRGLAVSSLDFDLSVYDIFGLLGVGGSLVVPEDGQHRDPSRWFDLVVTHRVTVWQSVPVLLDMLMIAARGPAPDLRWVFLGGDWIGLDLASRLRALSPSARLVALGGTTETAIHSTFCEVAEVPPHWRSVPYGRPLPGQRARVADRLGRDRPDWVPGELWIGGASVADGYCGDPELTDQRFVVHDDQRWYRTNDLARYLPDGTIELLGRMDSQLKIRGHRVEPGEITTALAEHDGVQDSIVLADDARRGLLAVVVPVTGITLQPEKLIDHLAQRLPDYLVPRRVLIRSDWPLSANGKVDRAAVAAWAATTNNPAGTTPTTVGPVENLVATLWADLLDRPTVDRGDSFFALGGDSLVATQFLVRLREAGVVGAELSRLFTHPVLRDFAAGLVIGQPPRLFPVLADAEPHEPFPPTDVQRAYWIGRHADLPLGGVAAHWYWEFDGADIDVARLEDALNRLIERHPMLRAVFDPEGRQRVLSEVPRYRILVESDDRDGSRRQAMREQLAARVADLARWPLIEVRAVHHGPDRTRLAFSLDLAVLDATSIVTFFAELGALYRRPDQELPALDVTFRAYALQGGRDRGEIEGAQAYWRARIADLPGPPTLPLAVDPAGVRVPRFVRRQTRLDRAGWGRLIEQAQAHDVTPAALLAAAYAEVLSAWSGQSRLTVNVTLFNRRPVHPDIGRVLGDFTSLLLVAYDAGGVRPWGDVVRGFQGQLWRDMEHDAVSALWVAREVANRSGTPIVTTPVVFTSALGVADGMASATLPFGSLVWGVSQTAQVWLDNQVMELDGELVINWDAVDDLFPPGVLDSMLAAYRQLLDWLAVHDWRAATPSLLPADQANVRQLVNATARPVPESTLWAVVAARASAGPDRVALLWGRNDQLTYGELVDRARRVAGGLRREGMSVGEPVGVGVGRGPRQIVAVLGVLAAGGCYVPVSPDQPADRRRRIHATAGVRLVLTDGPVAADEDAGATVRIDVAAAEAGSALSAPVAIDPDSPAYIIFTSGSTGAPKGVEVTHRAALNTIVDINRRFAVGSQDRAIAVSAMDFDLSVYDVFGMLSVGGALVLVDEDDRREPAAWLDSIDRRGVTIWNTVPALLDMLLIAAGEPPSTSGPDGSRLRLALISGDWIGLDLPGRVRDRFAGCRTVALGGATEAGIWSNFIEVATVPPEWRSIPYGVPLANQSFRVVDHRRRDCPDWVPGELWIGGASLATGYRGDERLTEERFVTDRGARWYRTGDSGRYWPDGTLEFLGRDDLQVKVLGHRIELGEVEAALLTHPDVDRVAVTVLDDGTIRRLAAAVVPARRAPADSLDHGSVLAWAADRLPAYMVPSSIISVPVLPLTANGKVDRSALNQPHRAGSLSTPAGGDPQGQLEEALAQMWQELLGCETVHRSDNFFTLGGDSLRAVRLVALVAQRFGREVSLRTIFAAPTLSDLAVAVQEALGADVLDMEEGQL